MRTGCALLLFAMFFAQGCSSGSVTAQVAAKNDSNIKRLVNLYSGYQLTHSWHGPKDENALRNFVTSHGLPEKNFEMMGIDPKNLDALFKSERDGKSFKIKFGVSGGIGSVNPVVFETEGVSGKRQVGFTTPIVEETDEARYSELWEKGGLPKGVDTGVGLRPGAKTDAGVRTNAPRQK